MPLYCFQDLLNGVKRIAEFFGLAPTVEQSQSIADRASFQVVRERSEETHGAAGPLLFRKGTFFLKKAVRNTVVSPPI